MAKKINVTAHEFKQLEHLAGIANNLTAPAGQRRLAKAQYEAILRLAQNRPNSPKMNNSRAL